MSRPVFWVKLIDALATGTSTGYNVEGVADELVFHFAWSAGGSLGVIVIEEAPDKDYAGTWSTITTVTQAGASQTDTVHVSGAFSAVRVRFTTNITGGTAIVTLLGVG